MKVVSKYVRRCIQINESHGSLLDNYYMYIRKETSSVLFWITTICTLERKLHQLMIFSSFES